MNEVDKARQITVDAQGNWQYPSQLKEGFEEIEIPALPGSTTNTESMHMRNFGNHVSSKIDSSMKTGYLRNQGPTEVLRHYAVVAKGAQLMDKDAISRMEDIATEFEAVPEKQEYFEMVIRPWLQSLEPRRR